MSGEHEDAQALPKLLTGSRRTVFCLLVLTGASHAVAAGGTVFALSRGLAASTVQGRVVAVLLLLVLAGGVGWLKYNERLLGERLGQNYVHEIRLGLVRHVLSGHKDGSLGATLTRASNDLTAVRNWVALGLAPLAVGVPLLLGCTVVLAMIHPLLGVAAAVPLVLLALVLWVSSRRVYDLAQRVRRERGRLAGHLADTLTATDAIRSAGGSYRELRRVDRRSARVVDAAIDRARVTGRIRGAAAAATGAATAAVVAVAMFADLSGALLAAALTVLGLMAGPVQDIGRVVEYRQSFRAAERMLVPAFDPTQGSTAPTHADGQAAGRVALDPPGLVVKDLVVAEHPELEVPPLYARAGDRVVVHTNDRAQGSAVLDALVGLHRPVSGSVRVSGCDLASASSRQRRELLGYAAQGMRLERTTIARAVRYRKPDSDAASVGDVLERFGLAERVARLPHAEQSRLRQGGEPLTPPDRARLLLARAMLGDPPLLVLDHVDAELGEQGRDLLRELLADYPGIVVLASDAPEVVMTATRRWRVASGPVVEAV